MLRAGACRRECISRCLHIKHWSRPAGEQAFFLGKSYFSNFGIVLRVDETFLIFIGFRVAYMYHYATFGLIKIPNLVFMYMYVCECVCCMSRCVYACVCVRVCVCV